MRPQHKSDLTRKRILDAARKLFNENGTSHVSTNLIARELGISPGNLYYHYRNKEEIIRELYLECSSYQDSTWNKDIGPEGNLMRMRSNLVEATRLSWKYRFVEREILALTEIDPELKSIYLENYRQRLALSVRLGEQLDSIGALRYPVSSVVCKDVMIAVWLVFQSWITFLDVTGNPEDSVQVQRGADIVLAILKPYLSAKGLKILGRSSSFLSSDKDMMLGDSLRTLSQNVRT